MKYSNIRLLKYYEIPNINDFSDLSRALSISSQTLYSLVNHKSLYYKQTYIPKKNGDYRLLNIPSFALKVVQRWIYEEILKKIPVSLASMAFVPGRNGIIECANIHKSNVFLLSMDIHAFFDSISKNSVRKLFYSLGYNGEISNLLTELCTLGDSLPQGAVTSPCLANLVCERLDARIMGLCKKRNIEYSRYADDLCFSSNNRLNLNKIVPIVTLILCDEGFELNKNKTHFSSNYSQKRVLGITINDNILHAKYEYKREIRSQIYNSIINGNYYNRQRLIGKIVFVNSIETNYKERILRYIQALISRDSFLRNKRLVDLYNANKFFKELPYIHYEEK